LLDTGRNTIKHHLGLRSFFRNLKTHSKLVLSVTFILIVSGWLIIFFLEYNNPGTLGNMKLSDKLLNSCFQSVTLRTAGFAAVDQGALKDSTVLVSIVYMLIGGSPVGTAGGIKTVSAAVIACSVIATIKGRSQAVIFNKSINEALIKRAIAVAFISVMFFFVFSVLLMVTNDVGLVDSAFEMGSAVATVGLSRGITSELNSVGQIIVIIAMYLGRIGPITMFIAFSNKYADKNHLHYGEADIIVG
jgi:trk system potassium uptake protein TrkH